MCQKTRQCACVQSRTNRDVAVPNCHYWPFAHRVSALGHLQNTGALALARSELLQRQPAFSCAFAERRLFYITNPAHLQLYLERLRKGGLSG